MRREKRGKRRASIDPYGFDAGKKIKGKKRHLLVDTQGLLMQALVHSADVQDRDGGALLLSTLAWPVPLSRKTVRRQRLSRADLRRSGRQNPVSGQARDRQTIRSREGFVTLPKRWIVERTIAWLNRCRRLAKDWDNLNLTALMFLRLASIRLMLRRLCNPA